MKIRKYNSFESLSWNAKRKVILRKINLLNFRAANSVFKLKYVSLKKNNRSLKKKI